MGTNVIQGMHALIASDSEKAFDSLDIITTNDSELDIVDEQPKQHTGY